jgi:glycine/D-amino acid oxidase-like deaminating enzyme
VAVSNDFCDLVVVGGGILGITLVMLVRDARPDWSVTLIDRGAPGGGATRWSGALVVPYGPDSRSRELMAASWRCFQRAPLRAYLRQVPAFGVVSESQLDEIQSAMIPGPLPLATEQDLLRLRTCYPDLRIGDDEVVLNAGDRAGVVDVAALVDDVLRFDDLRVWSGSLVQRVSRTQGGWVVVTAAGAEVHARHVVLATGPWTPPDVEPDVFGPRRVRVKRVAALHVEAPHARQRAEPCDGEAPHAGGRCPAVLFPSDDLFVLPDRHHLLVSFYRDEWLRADVPLTSGATAEDLRLGRAALKGRSPALERRVVGGRAFYDAYTSDRVPIVRPGVKDGIVEITGGSGSGVRFAPALAALALTTLDSRIDLQST